MTDVMTMEPGLDRPVARRTSPSQPTYIYSDPENAVTRYLVWTHILAGQSYLEVDLDSDEMASKVTSLAQVQSIPFASHGGYINGELMGVLIATAMKGDLLEYDSSCNSIAVMETTLELCRLVERMKSHPDEREAIELSYIPHCITRIDLLVAEEPEYVLDRLNMIHVCCAVVQAVLTEPDSGCLLVEDLRLSYPTLFNTGDLARQKYTELSNAVCPAVCQ